MVVFMAPPYVRVPTAGYYIKHIIGALCYSLLGLYFTWASLWNINLYVDEELSTAIYLMRTYKYFFFTIWNFGFQIAFLLVCVLDVIAAIWNVNSDLQDTIYQIRCYLFSAIVLPFTLLVVTVFWGLYSYDRELIYPFEIDDAIPDWMNHTLHTAIIIPVIIELLLPKYYLRLRNNTCFIILSSVFFAYATLFLMFYFVQGNWLYPIFEYCDWIARGCLALGAHFLALFYMCIGNFIQNAKVAPIPPKYL